MPPNIQIDAKLGCMINQFTLQMDHTKLSLYKKLCDLYRDLKQNAFILLTQKFSLLIL